MKLLTTIFFSALSTSAMACPSFDGTYYCHGEGIEQEFHVKTQDANGVTQYTLDGVQILADGVYRKVTYMGGEHDVQASCKGEALQVNILLDGGEGDNAECGTEKWNLLYTMNWTPAAGNTISEVHTGSTVCSSGKVIPSDMNGSMTCVKK